jgi:hypothetical protein
MAKVANKNASQRKVAFSLCLALKYSFAAFVSGYMQKISKFTPVFWTPGNPPMLNRAIVFKPAPFSHSIRRTRNRLSRIVEL